jgi:hypothetical protein
MIYLLIIIFLFLLLMIWIFYSSIRLVIDSEANEYYVSFGDQIKAKLIFEDGYPLLKAKIFFYEKIIDPLKKSRKKKKDKNKEKKEKVKKKSKRIIVDKLGFAEDSLKQMALFINTFKIEKLHLNLDTNDFIVNSYLAGAFSCLNRGNILLQANYLGDFQLKFCLENKIIRILITTIRSFFILKKYFVKIN